MDFNEFWSYFAPNYGIITCTVCSEATWESLEKDLGKMQHHAEEHKTNGKLPPTWEARNWRVTVN